MQLHVKSLNNNIQTVVIAQMSQNLWQSWTHIQVPFTQTNISQWYSNWKLETPFDVRSSSWENHQIPMLESHKEPFWDQRQGNHSAPHYTGLIVVISTSDNMAQAPVITQKTQHCKVICYIFGNPRVPSGFFPDSIHLSNNLQPNIPQEARVLIFNYKIYKIQIIS